jgi:hypothetical protein
MRVQFGGCFKIGGGGDAKFTRTEVSYRKLYYSDTKSIYLTKDVFVSECAAINVCKRQEEKLFFGRFSALAGEGSYRLC